MSWYRAVVVENRDPLSQGRVCLQVPQKFGVEVTGWAVPMDLGVTSHFVPAIGQVVWMTFEGDDESYPCYLPSITQIARGLGLIP